MKTLITFLFLLFTSVVHAQLPTSTAPLPPDIAAIKKRNVLIVAMTKKDVPPFFSGEGTDIKGLDVEISNRIGSILGVPVEFKRDANSFAEVVEQVRTGSADIAVSKLSITAPRLNTVRFSIPYVKLKQALIVNRVWLSQNSKGKEPYEVIRTFNGKISFIRNSSYDTFARTNFSKADYKPEDSWDTIINSVIRGDIAAGYRDEFEIKKISFERPEAAINTKTITISDSVDNIAAAVHFNSTHLLTIIDFVITNEFNNIDTKRLMDRYKAEKPTALAKK